MKRFLSVLLAVVMVVAMLPAGIVFAADGDNTDIVFDFVVTADELTEAVGDSTSWHGASGRSDYTQAFNWNNGVIASLMPEGISVSSTINSLPLDSYRFQTNNSLRLCNHNKAWYTASGRAVFGFDIEISADQAGWYRPSIGFSTSTGTGTFFSAYMVSNGVATYLGEVSRANSTNTGAPLNPVNLNEGTHTLALVCHTSDVNGQPTSYIKNIVLYAQNAAPAAIDVNTITVADSFNVGVNGNLDASSFALADGSSYTLGAYTMNPTTGVCAGASTTDYIQVTSSELYVALATKAGPKTTTITPRNAGSTTLTITPVVGGVAQTEMAATKTISVVDPTNIIFDFRTWLNIHGQGASADKSIARFDMLKASNSPEGIAVNAVSAANNQIYWETTNNSLRFGNIVSDWEDGTDRNNKFVFDITVGEGKAGLYTMSFPFSGNAGMNNNMTVYHVFNGKATYVGDIDTVNYTTLPFAMSEGVNTIAICATGDINVAYISSMSFNKYTGELPTMQEVVVNVPETLAVDETVADLSATVSMSDGTNYKFPGLAINTTTFKNAGADTANYLKIEATPAGVVEIVKSESGILLNRDKTVYTIKGLKGGTATLKFTPVVDGVEQTAVAKTATIKVKSWDIKYDFEPIHVTYVRDNEELREVNRPLNDISKVFSVKPELKNFMPEGIVLSSLNVDDALMRWNTSSLRFCSHNALWTSNGSNSRLAFDITLDAEQAGWYRANFQSPSGFSASFYVYAIRADGSVKYLGDLTANGKRLNPVYLGEGVHTLVLGCYAKNGADATTYIQEINLYRYENAPTMTTFSANIPTAIAYGATADVTFESATLSDTGRFEYGTYTMLADGQARFDKTGTEDYMLVESSDPAIATVTRNGADTWTITPVSDGETTITVTPYYNGVAYDALKQTKTVFVTYPNASVNYNPNFIVNAVVGNEGLNAEAASLITSDEIAVGEIASAALGTTVKLTATSGNGLKFLYWYNGNSKKMLSDEEEYSFEVGTKAAIYAKYAREDAELVEYFSAAGQLIDEAEGTFGAEPSAKLGNYYKLYKDTTPAVEGESVTATSDDANFVCWKKDGKVVSYNATYTYYKLGDEEVVAVTEGEKSDVPAVVLFSEGNTHMLELVNFEGVDIVEKGILFADGGVPTVNNFGAKAVASENTNQFIASSDAANAVAYVIYRDGGNYRVAYSAE